MEHRDGDCVVSGPSILEYFRTVVFVTAIKKVITQRRGYSGVVGTKKSLATSSQAKDKEQELEQELELEADAEAEDEEQLDISLDEDADDSDDDTDAEEAASGEKVSASKSKAKIRALQRERQYRHGAWKWKDSQTINPFGTEQPDPPAIPRVVSIVKNIKEKTSGELVGYHIFFL